MSGRDFWTRRRAAVAAEKVADQVALEAADAAAVEADFEARTDEEILAERNLPDPDTLETPEDVRAFLSEALPQRLKARALRRLWRLNPVLANLDGLVDYGEDFTDSATVIENLQTAYQVGKGMLKHLEALAEAEAAQDDDGAPEAEPAEDEMIATAEDEPESAFDQPAVAPAPPAYETPDEDQAAPVVDPSRRRMRFQFEMQT